MQLLCLDKESDKRSAEHDRSEEGSQQLLLAYTHEKKVHIDRRYSLHLQISRALVEAQVVITKTKKGSTMSCQHYEICKVAILTAQSLYPNLPIC